MGVSTYQNSFFPIPDSSLVNFKIGLSNVYLTSDESDTSNYSVLELYVHYYFAFFSQNLLGLRAKTWKLLMNATSDLNEDWLRYKRDEIGHAQLYYLDMNAYLNSLVHMWAEFSVQGA